MRKNFYAILNLSTNTPKENTRLWGWAVSVDLFLSANNITTDPKLATFDSMWRVVDQDGYLNPRSPHGSLDAFMDEVGEF